MNLYWGDLHNHCGISYGYGSLENALKAAKGQLDFCAIIGHASWFDIPERKAPLEYLVDFHKEGFAKLQRNWEEVRRTVKAYNVPHEFVTFQGFEAHSSKYGDHHYLSPDDEMPLVAGETPEEIIAKLSPHRAIAIPHHVGYTPGYRGGNWESFNSAISPVIEVHSKHGCGMSEQSMYPYYHDMGPRDPRSTVYAALNKGHRFGFVGSTDHHAGYPGSYGDGRLAVLAGEKTREAIWEAILARRTYAVTGDKIACRFKLNGHDMGSEVQAGQRTLSLDVRGCDQLDKIVVYKNLKPWKIINGEELRRAKAAGEQKYKIKVELGWGNNKTGFKWEASASVQGGKLISVETCFRGRSVLAPTPEMREDPDMNALGNEVVSQSESSVVWNCTSFPNPTTLHPHTSGVILEVAGHADTRIEVRANGKTITAAIGELLAGGQSVHLHPYNSEAIFVHRAVPEELYSFHGQWEDSAAEAPCDVYHAEIRQMNGQCAWISPIYALA